MTYPDQPGWKGTETSRAAAEMVAGKQATMLALVEGVIAERPASPEQVQAILHNRGTPALLTSVRARVCQLRALGKVVDSGERGLGESRRAKVIIWRATSPEERALFAARKALADEKGPDHG